MFLKQELTKSSKIYHIYSPQKKIVSNPIGASVSCFRNADNQLDTTFQSREQDRGRAVCRYLGRQVSCGLFGIGDDFIEKYQSLDKRFIKNQASTFFFEATGQSMAPLILPGDILVVDRSIEVLNNKVVVAHLDGAMICKRYYKKADCITLKSDNKTNRPIMVTTEMNFIMFGVVTAIAREV